MNQQKVTDQLLDKLEASFGKALALCARNADRLDGEENRDHWFAVLDCILEGFERFSPHLYLDSGRLEPFLNRCIKSLLESMIDCVDFKTMIAHIVEQFGAVPFKYFKDNLVSVLSRLSYQQNILSKAIDLLNYDIKHMTHTFLSVRNRGICSMEMKCGKCLRSVALDDRNRGADKVMFFLCGHIYHSKCCALQECEACAEEERRKGLYVIENRRQEGRLLK